MISDPKEWEDLSVDTKRELAVLVPRLSTQTRPSSHRPDRPLAMSLRSR